MSILKKRQLDTGTLMTQAMEANGLLLITKIMATGASMMEVVTQVHGGIMAKSQTELGQQIPPTQL